ncbi:MAG: pyrroloquinoline quinone biosynthesis peptide chaperone PqqD [Pseudolabrys sp.]
MEIRPRYFASQGGLRRSQKHTARRVRAGRAIAISETRHRGNAIVSCGIRQTAAWNHLAEEFTIAPGAKPRLPRGVRLTHSEAQGGWVLLAPERIFKADAIAFEILRRCTGEATFDALVDDLARTFDAPRERIHADVTKLLASLAEKKLLEL